MSGSTETYDLSGVLGLEGTAALAPGTSLLLSGPAMTGKDALLYEVLADGVGRDEGCVLVTTEGDGGDALSDIATRQPDVDHSLLCAVDCRATRGREESEDGDGFVYSVGGPAEFTGIGIGITKCFDRLAGAGVGRARFGLTSLSTMIEYTDKQPVFKLCHVLTQRLDSEGYVGLFTLNEGAHDPQTIQVIRQAFDANVEVRERNGERQVRALGMGSGPTDWEPLE